MKEGREKRESSFLWKRTTCRSKEIISKRERGEKKRGKSGKTLISNRRLAPFCFGLRGKAQCWSRAAPGAIGRGEMPGGAPLRGYLGPGGPYVAAGHCVGPAVLNFRADPAQRGAPREHRTVMQVGKSTLFYRGFIITVVIIRNIFTAQARLTQWMDSVCSHPGGTHSPFGIFWVKVDENPQSFAFEQSIER